MQEVWHFAAAVHIVVEADHLSPSLAGVYDGLEVGPRGGGAPGLAWPLGPSIFISCDHLSAELRLAAARRSMVRLIDGGL